jgi:hypothetical protein
VQRAREDEAQCEPGDLRDGLRRSESRRVAYDALEAR